MRAAVLVIATLAVGAGACKKESKSGSSTEAAKSGGPGATAAVAPPPVPEGATRITAAQYVVDVVAPADCKAGAPCAVSLQLHALGDFHVNRDYPHKFVTGDGGVVTTAPATLEIASDRTGTMTLAFEAPAAGGTAKVSGNFKLSVCSDENCVIEEPAITAAVPVI